MRKLLKAAAIAAIATALLAPVTAALPPAPTIGPLDFGSAGMPNVGIGTPYFPPLDAELAQMVSRPGDYAGRRADVYGEVTHAYVNAGGQAVIEARIGTGQDARTWNAAVTLTPDAGVNLAGKVRGNRFRATITNSGQVINDPGSTGARTEFVVAEIAGM
ncbi:hypothetical protein ACFWUP_22835 [Nocardia sp. NPDC058658]|uniref:hypothetical protein n=1 Tax=Nocardia sp. NPDC058658 TaxID=3346580 RepID=UPI003646197D